LISSDKGRDEIDTLIDVMTTNKTSFFRESAHFDYLTEEILPAFTHRRLRFWSAACSSGEEPYTLAMVLREAIPAIDQKDVLILSTDISNQMLETARKGIYSKERLAAFRRPMSKNILNACPMARNNAIASVRNCANWYGWPR
jgi:chemotaxis protein methyltransferase CheR